MAHKRKKKGWKCNRCGQSVNIYRKGKKHRIMHCPVCGVIAINPKKGSMSRAISGQKARLANVGAVYKSIFTGRGVQAPKIKNQMLRSAVETAASHPFATAGVVAGGATLGRKIGLAGLKKGYQVGKSVYNALPEDDEEVVDEEDEEIDEEDEEDES
jgi:DNA-directed RNA polymerase subunit RPC12/RpoP